MPLINFLLSCHIFGSSENLKLGVTLSETPSSKQWVANVNVCFIIFKRTEMFLVSGGEISTGHFDMETITLWKCQIFLYIKKHLASALNNTLLSFLLKTDFNVRTIVLLSAHLYAGNM